MKLVIVNYGMGNLRSVQKAFEQVGCAALVSDRPDDVESADKLVLPGVGAFRDAMEELRKRGLLDTILQRLRSRVPFLGVCLGLQLLFSVSHENGEHQGFDVLAGEVERLPNVDPKTGERLKVPHIGWNEIRVIKRAPILKGVRDGTHMYFVHSYYGNPRQPEVIAADTDYGARFPSVIWQGNLFATQFHPEKSQKEGLKVLENFALL